MRILALIIAIIGAIITIIFTIFPVGNLTVFPALITIICGLILIRLHKSENRSNSIPKIIIGIALLGAIISSTKAMLTEDIIVNDKEFELKEQKSKTDAIKDLEELE